MAQVIAGERPPTPSTMPYACESLLKKLWHKSASLRPTFAETIPTLESILETLPVGVPSRGSMPLDSLDSLDELSRLSLKAR